MAPDFVDLIDSKAREYYADLGRDMPRQCTYMTREEHEAWLQSIEKQPKRKQAPFTPRSASAQQIDPETILIPCRASGMAPRANFHSWLLFPTLFPARTSQLNLAA